MLHKEWYQHCRHGLYDANLKRLTSAVVEFVKTLKLKDRIKTKTAQEILINNQNKTMPRQWQQSKNYGAVLTRRKEQPKNCSELFHNIFWKIGLSAKAGLVGLVWPSGSLVVIRFGWPNPKIYGRTLFFFSHHPAPLLFYFIVISLLEGVI